MWRKQCRSVRGLMRRLFLARSHSAKSPSCQVGATRTHNARAMEIGGENVGNSWRGWGNLRFVILPRPITPSLSSNSNAGGDPVLQARRSLLLWQIFSGLRDPSSPRPAKRGAPCFVPQPPSPLGRRNGNTLLPSPVERGRRPCAAGGPTFCWSVNSGGGGEAPLRG